MLSQVLHRLSQSERARRWITTLPPTRRLARRFVAGEELDEALAVVAALNGHGIRATLNRLGEHADNAEGTHEAAQAYRALVEAIAENDLESSVSPKPTQLGLGIDEGLCRDNARTIAERAAELGVFVRLDMESSETVDATLRVYERLREAGYANVGVVIQAYLYRSEADVDWLIERGANVRLCKGAYAEPTHVAFARKADVDANFRHLLDRLWQPEAQARGVYAAIATHDRTLIRWARDRIATQNVPTDRYEFQMLYGVERQLQRQLAEEGEPIRVYVSYGTEWYPYFMRRLAERPANVLFLARQLIRR